MKVLIEVLKFFFRNARLRNAKCYAAPNIGTTILNWFKSLFKMLSPTENSRIKDFSRL